MTVRVKFHAECSSCSLHIAVMPYAAFIGHPYKAEERCLICPGCKKMLIVNLWDLEVIHKNPPFFDYENSERLENVYIFKKPIP